MWHYLQGCTGHCSFSQLYYVQRTRSIVKAQYARNLVPLSFSLSLSLSAFLRARIFWYHTCRPLILRRCSEPTFHASPSKTWNCICKQKYSYCERLSSSSLSHSIASNVQCSEGHFSLQQQRVMAFFFFSFLLAYITNHHECEQPSKHTDERNQPTRVVLLYVQ